MLTEVEVQREIEAGLSAVCAWCTHYWAAKAQMPLGMCGCGRVDCGGPIAGRAFPQYSGPRANKAAYCFVCGGEAQMAVEFHQEGAGGMVGCCADHERVLKGLLADRRKKIVVRERLVPVIGVKAEGDA